MRVATAIIGAGFAGIAMAIALKRAGRTDFVLIERADEPGGTWRDNTYPGVACDVPSHLYGFATHPHPAWTRTFAGGGEILRYLFDVIRAEGLDRSLRLRTPLHSARWDAATGTWQLNAGGDVIVADELVLACGRLTEPLTPDIPGLDTFPRPMFHSARWNHTMEISGSRIAVVGTGASAVQLVPELVRRGGRVVLFQRTPAWIVPRGGRRHSAAERRRLAEHPEELAQLRQTLYREGEARHPSRSGDVAAAKAARATALAHLATQVADPHLRAALTPAYDFGCKRVLLSDDFYPAVASAATDLEPSALVGVDGTRLLAASGRAHEVDALVFATGFHTTRQPYARLVTGEGGVSLDEHWSTGMRSWGSTLVAGFPNLFVINGPNAALGHNSAVLMMEEQAKLVLRCLEHRDATGAPLRVTARAEAAYSAQIDEMAASTPWMSGGCRNWYVDERSNRLTLLWPGTVADYRRALDVPFDEVLTTDERMRVSAGGIR